MKSVGCNIRYQIRLELERADWYRVDIQVQGVVRVGVWTGIRGSIPGRTREHLEGSVMDISGVLGL